MGEAFACLGRTAEAATAYDRALALDPANETAMTGVEHLRADR